MHDTGGKLKKSSIRNFFIISFGHQKFAAGVVDTGGAP
jgi:hypothetical protein